MRLPEKDGRLYVSATLLRTYGADMTLAGGEAPRGCPKKFRATYHDKTLRRETSAPLTFGLIIHEALRFMEEYGMGPEEALQKAWTESEEGYLTPVEYQEALDDLREYLNRPSTPLDRYMVLETESSLEALLFVHPVHGEVWYRCRVDAISLDHDNPAIVHVGDWKTNRQPPSVEDVMGDIQLKGNAWCVYQNADRLVPNIPQPRVVVHLDAIKHRELPPVYFPPNVMEAWYEWTVSLVNRILDDDEGAPRINEGCAYCPLRDTCEAYLALPDLITELAQIKPERRDDIVNWRDRLAAAKNLAERAVKDVDERIRADVDLTGEVVAAGSRWAREPNWINDVDVRALHGVMGDPFYDLVKTSKTAINTAARGADPETAVAMKGCVSRRVNGTKIERRVLNGD